MPSLTYEPRILKEPPVPAEFQGLARDFRAQIRKQTGIYDTELSKIIRSLRAHWDRRPQHRVRQEVLRGAMRDFLMNLPESGRLDIKCNLGKNKLSMAECRLVTGTTTCKKWQNAEEELSITAEIGTLICSPAKFMFAYDCAAIFSHHALARRFERSTRDSKEVIEDLITVIRQKDRFLASNRPYFEIPCERGVWGADRVLVNFNTDRGSAEALAVRTFLSRSMQPRPSNQLHEQSPAA